MKHLIQSILKKRIRSGKLSVVLYALLPVFVMCCLECYTHEPYDLTLAIFLANLLVYELLYLLLLFVIGHSCISAVISALIPMLFGMINRIVVEFRSSPIVPWDLYSIKTAASVAGNYSFVPDMIFCLVIIGFVLLIFIGAKTGIVIRRKLVRLAGAVLSACCLFAYVQFLQTDQAVELLKLDTTLFTPNVLYRNNGLTVGFLANLRYLKVEKPEGYSVDKVHAIADAVINSGDNGDTDMQANQNLPNVIVIMDEAFSDLSVFGEFGVDQDYMPYIHGLTENTVKGNCYVSVKGGNTANSEYEFLTGDSMAFMPAGSVPYQQYVKQEMPGIASYLKELGYDTLAIHPYKASGWARNTVYPMLGFDRMLFKEDFQGAPKIREYISDEAAFLKIIQKYEEKEKGEHLFAFEVTMQNHGGYSKSVDTFQPTVHFTEIDDSSTQAKSAECYLSLMQYTDTAFSQLTSYFSMQDEKTVILLFGDHQPSDYVTNVILKALGLSREDDNAYFNNYIVPFVIWANYDIEEEYVDGISVNYLSSLLFEKAGIALTPYQKYLSELRGTIPVITANMLMDSQGNRYRYDDGALRWPDELLSYQMLTYNHIADVKKRLSGFFDNRE